MSIQVYGIPTCSTCRKALKWLKEEGVSHTWHNTRENRPSRGDITQWVTELGFGPLRNTSGGSYRALGEDKKVWGDKNWIEAFSADPMLLKRPIFVKDGKAILTGFRGSPEELRTKLRLN